MPIMDVLLVLDLVKLVVQPINVFHVSLLDILLIQLEFVLLNVEMEFLLVHNLVILEILLLQDVKIVKFKTVGLVQDNLQSVNQILFLQLQQFLQLQLFQILQLSLLQQLVFPIYLNQEM